MKRYVNKILSPKGKITIDVNDGKVIRAAVWNNPTKREFLLLNYLMGEKVVSSSSCMSDYETSKEMVMLMQECFAIFDCGFIEDVLDEGGWEEL